MPSDEQGRSLEETMAIMEQKYWTTLKTNWCVHSALA